MRDDVNDKAEKQLESADDKLKDIYRNIMGGRDIEYYYDEDDDEEE